MKQLPNILSCLRILLAGLLLIIIDYSILFLLVYFLCGITDILDGLIARRYRFESELGAKLDSLGDLVFWTVVLYLMIFRIEIKIDSFLIIAIIIIAILRVINIIITKVKFNEWGIIHSISNKATGFLIFIAIPICIYLEFISFIVSIPVIFIALLSALEESFILILSENYSPNFKSILQWGDKQL